MPGMARPTVSVCRWMSSPIRVWVMTGEFSVSPEQIVIYRM